MKQHLTDDELKDTAQGMLQAFPHLTVWRHYKGGIYTLVACSLNESTLEPMVTYRSNRKGTYWTRTLNNFVEQVETSPGLFCPRFTQVRD
jgi:hypothetical protein